MDYDTDHEPGDRPEVAPITPVLRDAPTWPPHGPLSPRSKQKGLFAGLSSGAYRIEPVTSSLQSLVSG
jgi:hypothetical protein